MNHRFEILCLVFLCLVLTGCNTRNYTGDQRYSLSGTVTVDGQPMDVGRISFLPKSGDSQRVSGGPILDGKYSVTEEMGPNAGPHRVEIRWDKKTGGKYKDRDSGEIYDRRKEGLPSRYHAESELTAEVSETQTEFDFDLKSQ